MNTNKIKEDLRKVAPLFAKRAAPVYAFNKWTWVGDDKRFVPSEADILRAALSIINGLADGYDYHRSKCGRVEVIVGERVGIIQIEDPFWDECRSMCLDPCLTASSEAEAHT